MISAGLLMFSQHRGNTEVFLVHPGGPFYKNKDEGVWSIPKGLQEGEEALLETAKREFREETGIVPQGPYTELGSVKMKSGKIIYVWAFEGKEETPELISNRFTMEWPPKSGKQCDFPEVDRAAYVSPEKAAMLIHPSQKPFIERLLEYIEDLKK